MGYIYAILNLKNQKYYVGKTTKTIEERYDSHKISSKYGSNRLIHKALRKYSEENFEIILLEQVNDDLLDLREKYYIIEYKSMMPSGYNMTFGGEGGDTSKSLNYIESMKKRRSFAGESNPNYGKIGELSSKFGKKYGKKPKISEGTKKNWDNNIERKKLASDRIKGKNNPMHGKKPKNSIKIKLNDVIYESFNDAAKYTGLSVYRVKKQGEIINNA
jgi:group I intron endonuclease